MDVAARAAGAVVPQAADRKARDFNWHNVIGFWSAVPRFFIVISGAVMSYPWANILIYTLTGDKPPTGGRSPASKGSASMPVIQINDLDEAWSLAQTHAPEWQMAAVRLPDSDQAPFVFTFDGSARRGRPDPTGRGDCRSNKIRIDPSRAVRFV